MGTIVATVNPPVRKPDRVGRAAARRAHSSVMSARPNVTSWPPAPAAMSANSVVKAAPCHDSSGAATASTASPQQARPLGSTGRGPAQASTACVHPVHELGEPAQQVQVGRVDVVARGRVAEPPGFGLHGGAEQQPVQAVAPGPLGDPGQSVVGPMLLGQPPTDPGLPDPVAQPARVVGVEAEPPADRGGRGQVQHLGGGDPARGQSQQHRRGGASNGLAVCGARSANRTRSRPAGWAPAARAASVPANAAATNGANSSMSGHITRMSRGCSVGSAASRCSTASRSTSTCRARPWQECTTRLASCAASPAAAGRRRPAPGRSPARTSTGRADRPRAPVQHADVGRPPVRPRPTVAATPRPPGPSTRAAGAGRCRPAATRVPRPPARRGATTGVRRAGRQRGEHLQPGSW